MSNPNQHTTESSSSRLTAVLIGVTAITAALEPKVALIPLGGVAVAGARDLYIFVKNRRQGSSNG